MGRRWVTAELLPDTVDKFIMPRLGKVIEGTDPGGITYTKTRAAVDELPAGVTADDAHKFVQLLTKFTGHAEESAEPDLMAPPLGADEYAGIGVDVEAILKKMSRKTRTNMYPTPVDDWPCPEAVAELADAVTRAWEQRLKAAAKTSEVKRRNWFGGGSFRHLVVGPSMFARDEDGQIYIASWAHGGDLARAVAAQIGFQYDDSRYPFDGAKGNLRLAVIDGTVTGDIVKHLQSHLKQGESVIIYATQIDPSARDVLVGGSRLEKIPTSILESYRKGQPRL